MKHANELKIGIWTIISIVVLVVGIKFLKGQLHTSNTYYMICTDVTGLAESSHVKMNGFKVGFVSDMTYDYNKANVLVELSIDPDLRITRGSVASIEPDLLGTSNVIITLGEGSEYLSSGDTICGGGLQSGLMDGVTSLMPAVGALLPKIDSILTNLNTIVSDSKLQESLLEVNAIAHQLKATVGELNSRLPSILDNANSASANLDAMSENLRAIDLQPILAQADSALAKANEALSALSGTEGTAARLINSNELHDQLTQTLADVDSLVADIKQNPKRYINIKVFGK